MNKKALFAAVVGLGVVLSASVYAATAVNNRNCPLGQNTAVCEGNFGFSEIHNYGKPNSVARVLNAQEDGFYLQINSEGKNAGIQMRHIPVSAGKSYRLTFDYVLEKGLIYPRLGIRNSNADFERKQLKIRDLTFGQWATYTRDFTVPSSFNGDFRIVISSQNAIWSVDNISITENNQPTLIQDGDMEQLGRGSWRNYGRPNEVTKVPKNGPEDTALFVDSVGKGSGVTSEYISVVAGKTYKLSFDYKATGSRFRARINMPGFGGNNSDFEAHYRNIANSEDWANYERTFTVPNDLAGNIRIFFSIRGGYFFLDNVKLEEVLEEESNSTAQTRATVLDPETGFSNDMMIF